MTQLSEAGARRALALLRSTDTIETEVALDRLLRAIPSRAPRTRRVIALAVAVTVACVAIAVVVFDGSAHRSPVGTRPVLIASQAPVPSQPQPQLTLDDGLSSPEGLIDVDGALWVDSYADHKLLRVQIANRRVERIGTGTGILATLGQQVYVLDLTTGIADIRFPTGVLRRSVDLGSGTKGTEPQNITAEGQHSDAGLWTATCCDAPGPLQHLQQRDPTTLAPDPQSLEVNIKAEGDSGSQLAAGAAGVWFLNPDGTFLYQVFGSADGRPTKTFNVAKRLEDTIAANTLSAVNASYLVFETSSGALTTLDPSTEEMRQGPRVDDVNGPSGLVVTGNVAYVAFSDRVIAYDLSTLKQTGSYAVRGVTALTAGPDGVWAATGGQLVRLAD